MSTTFTKAQPQQAALKAAIYGKPGSGKTFTALLIAEGLAKRDGKRIAYIDTEHGTDFYARDVKERGCHPAAFDFDALYTRSIQDAMRAFAGLKHETHGVVVIDSITHLWEACMLAYTGKKTRAETIPMHAWGKIKKPYKDLVNALMSSPFHVLILGREGTEYADDPESGELKAIGAKMKAEGETAYEPALLLRMELVRHAKGKESTITAYAEKDRSGVLAGKVIEWPTFDSIALPILALLTGEQARLPTIDETAADDADVFDRPPVLDRDERRQIHQAIEKVRANKRLALSHVMEAAVRIAGKPIAKFSDMNTAQLVRVKHWIDAYDAGNANTYLPAVAADTPAAAVAQISAEAAPKAAASKEHRDAVIAKVKEVTALGVKLGLTSTEVLDTATEVLGFQVHQMGRLEPDELDKIKERMASVAAEMATAPTLDEQAAADPTIQRDIPF